eukprot:scaffold66168_cov66-Phaeocystis_antarctica.AAC.4
MRGPPCGGLSAGWLSAWSTLLPRGGPSGRTARRRGAASLSSVAASPVGLCRSCLAARLGRGRHACQGSEGSGSVASRRSPSWEGRARLPPPPAGRAACGSHSALRRRAS